VSQDVRWMNDLPYVDTEQHAHTLAVIDCLETNRADGQPKTTRFRWVTNFNVTPTTVLTLANQGGRLRWKIENEGFNVQKHGGYALEHAYTQNPTAAKVFYFLISALRHNLSRPREKPCAPIRSSRRQAASACAKNLALHKPILQR
jgi:hypothetical protein